MVAKRSFVIQTIYTWLGRTTSRCGTLLRINVSLELYAPGPSAGAVDDDNVGANGTLCTIDAVYIVSGIIQNATILN